MQDLLWLMQRTFAINYITKKLLLLSEFESLVAQPNCPIALISVHFSVGFPLRSSREKICRLS